MKFLPQYRRLYYTWTMWCESIQEFQDAEERREELKQQIAVACSQLLREPEAHTRNLRALLALTVDNDIEVGEAMHMTL